MSCYICTVFTAYFDYAPTSGVMTFDGAKSRQCTGVAIIDDSVVENSEIFTFSLSSFDNAVQFSTSAAAVVIQDDADSM